MQFSLLNFCRSSLRMCWSGCKYLKNPGFLCLAAEMLPSPQKLTLVMQTKPVHMFLLNLLYLALKWTQKQRFSAPIERDPTIQRGGSGDEPIMWNLIGAARTVTLSENAFWTKEEMKSLREHKWQTRSKMAICSWLVRRDILAAGDWKARGYRSLEIVRFESDLFGSWLILESQAPPIMTKHSKKFNLSHFLSWDWPLFKFHSMSFYMTIYGIKALKVQTTPFWSLPNTRLCTKTTQTREIKLKMSTQSALTAHPVIKQVKHSWSRMNGKAGVPSFSAIING